jgi:hypothetical protein
MKIPTWVWIAGAAGLGWWLWKRNQSAAPAAVPGLQPLAPGQLQPISVTVPTPSVPNLPDVGRSGAFQIPTDFGVANPTGGWS